MTDDPLRLIEDGELTADERRALEIGVTERSPIGAKAAIWGALSIKLAAPATAAAATVGSAAAGTATVGATAAGTATAASAAGTVGAGFLTTVALVKSAGVGLALGAAVGTGLYLGGRAASSPVERHPLVLEGATSVTEPFHDRANAAKARNASEIPSAAPTAPSAGASETHGDGSRAERTRPAPPAPTESQRVARARTLLNAGDPTHALEVLGALERDEPNGLLVQEREALTIEALASLGRHDAARTRADAFLGRYPASPYVLAVRRAAGYAK